MRAETRALFALTLIALFSALSAASASPAEQARVLVIPVEFKDLHGPGSPQALAKASGLEDYWEEVSYGALELEVEVLSTWVELDRSYLSYARDVEGIDDGSCQLVWDTLKKADPLADFSEYDYVMIMHAGEDQAITHDEDDFWSRTVYCGSWKTGDGVFSRMVSIISRGDPLGVWAHEFGHLLGLPDLYNVERLEERDNFVGRWGLMAEGSWNGPPGARGSVPAGLLSWGRIKLGWMTGDAVVVVENGEERTLTLVPLEKAEGLRAVKLPLNGRQYLLVEARRKLGYDAYLPGEGVLILQVNEGKESGKGIVVVIPPEGHGLDDAAFSPGQSFTDEEHLIRVEVLEEGEEGYVVKVSYGVPRRLLRVTVLPGAKIWVNGTLYLAGEDGVLELELEEGVYLVEVEGEVLGDGVKWVFEGWLNGSSSPSIHISLHKDTHLQAIYSTWYLVEVESERGEVRGEGWYQEGSEAVVEVEPEVVQEAEGVRYVFSGWVGDAEGSEPVLRFVVDGPKKIEATWRKQFRVLVSPWPGEWETCWIDEGGMLEVSAAGDKELGNGTKLAFRRWLGADSAERVLRLNVSKPLVLTAVWERLYKVELVNLKGFGEKVLWVGEGEMLELAAPKYLDLGEGERLRFKGWRGGLETEERELSLRIEQPVRIEATWVKEFLVAPIPLSLDGAPAQLQPVKIIFSRNGAEVVWSGSPVWLEEGVWRVEATWMGLKLETGSQVEVKGRKLLIPTNLRRIHLTVLDLAGSRLSAQITAESDGVILYDGHGSEAEIYLPENAEETEVTASHGWITARIPNPEKSRIVIILPAIVIGPTTITLGQILTLIIIVVLMVAARYSRKPATMRAATAATSKATRSVDLTENLISHTPQTPENNPR